MKAILLALLSTQALANTVYVGDYSLSSVAVDKQIAVLAGAYSSSFYFRGYYGYLSRTFTGIDEISMKDAVHTYIQFKTNHEWREIISTNYEEVDFLMW